MNINDRNVLIVRWWCLSFSIYLWLTFMSSIVSSRWCCVSRNLWTTSQSVQVCNSVRGCVRPSASRWTSNPSQTSTTIRWSSSTSSRSTRPSWSRTNYCFSTCLGRIEHFTKLRFVIFRIRFDSVEIEIFLCLCFFTIFIFSDDNLSFFPTAKVRLNLAAPHWMFLQICSRFYFNYYFI